MPVRNLDDISLPFGSKAPMWYLRITHTRLADAILDICGVPQKEVMRRQCFRIFTQHTAPSPSHLLDNSPFRRKRSNSKQDFATPIEILQSSMDDLHENYGIPKSAVSSLTNFVKCGCCPLPVDIKEATVKLQASINKLRHELGGEIEDSRRFKRFEDASKSLKHLTLLVDLLAATEIGALLHVPSEGTQTISRPLFLSLDLGLRQRRKHFHGHTFFQCIVIPNDYLSNATDYNEMESNDKLLASNGVGVKVAEGGRYDDLVRRFRPPGNFGSALLDHYTAAPLPKVSSIQLDQTDSQYPLTL